MGVQIELPHLDDKYQNIRPLIMQTLAAVMQTNRGMIFHTSGTYNGRNGWAALEWRNGQPLKDSGALSNSMGPFANGKPISNAGSILQVSPEKVTVGTNLHYAQLMNDGTTKMPDGVMRAKNGGVLKIPVPQGKNAGPTAKKVNATREPRKSKIKGDKNKYIFRKFVRIPARPFDDINQRDVEEFIATIETFAVRMLNE